MAVDFKTWAKQTENHFWDMDGNYGPQCWDLWAKYCMDEYGCSVQDCITPTGWAGGLYTHHPVSARVGEIFEKKDNTWNPMPGDVAIWQVCYPNYPSTHVAIVVDGIQGDSIDVITQNPEPSVHKLLPLQKACIGYLHPRKKPDGGDNNSGSNNTGSNNPGSTSSSDAWIQQQGDNLIYHYRDNDSGAGTLIFYKATAQTWTAKGSAKAPNDSNGQATPSVGNGKSSYALYCIGTVESSLQWDAVELANMQGIGIAQWSFGRRLDVLNAMKTADPTGYETFAKTCPEIAALMDNGGVFTRPLTSAESAAFKTWAQRPESHQGQRNQFEADYNGYPHVYDNVKMQILWASAYHQGPAYAEALPKATTLDGLLGNLLNDGVFGQYPGRYRTVYNLLVVWDGTSAPPNF